MLSAVSLLYMHCTLLTLLTCVDKTGVVDSRPEMPPQTKCTTLQTPATYLRHIINSSIPLEPAVNRVGLVHNIWLRSELEALGQCIPPPSLVLPVPRCGSGSPPKFCHLFIGPLPTIPESFIVQIHLEVFAHYLLTDKQTNNDEHISSLAEVITCTRKLTGISFGHGWIHFMEP